MIVLILAGGLGNQMFEYAAARSMSLRNETQLILNTRTGFKRDKVFNRVFALDAFNIKYKRNRILSFDFPFGYIFENISKRLGWHILVPWYKYVFDNEPKVEQLLKKKMRNVILSGTWVKQDYFSDYIDTIRKDFTFQFSITSQMKYYFKKIDESQIPVIGMGVRIYQEIKDEGVRKRGFFYTESDFYNNAINFYRAKYGKFILLVFTQVKEWVLENIDLQGIEYEFVCASTCDKDAVNEMVIMSRCNHYIISNSSFYFWGVWLNPNKKDVVIPKKWTNSSLNEWIKI